jgi:hypothetical protein
MAADVEKELIYFYYNYKNITFFPTAGRYNICTNLSQLLAYVGFIFGETISGDILFCKPLLPLTTRKEIIKFLD